MKRMYVWAALALALTGAEAQGQALSSEAALRRAEADIRAAMETVAQKGMPGHKAVLRDSQRNWLGKGRDKAMDNIQVGNLSDMQKNALVTQSRALKLQAFARQVEAGSKPITLNGKARRMSDEGGSGWSICSQVSVTNATRSSCMVVAHKTDLTRNETLTNTLDSAAAEGLEIAVTGMLASPEGFDPATVNVAVLRPETPPAPEADGAPEQAQATPATPQAQQRQATP